MQKFNSSSNNNNKGILLRKLLLLLAGVVLLALIISANAEVAGDYLFYPYGIDTNIGSFVADSNGSIISDFSANCYLDGKHQETNVRVFDGNLMLNDPILPGFYYLKVPFSNTTAYPRGKYDVLMRCSDGDQNGVDLLSFILDTNTSSLIKDVNQTIKDVNSSIFGKLNDLNSTTLTNILRIVTDVNTFVGDEFTSLAFDDDLNLYSDNAFSGLAHGLDYQPNTVLFYRGKADSGTLPVTSHFSTVSTVFCTINEICFSAEQVSPPIVVGGLVTGSVRVPRIDVGDYNFYLLASGKDNSNTNVTLNGATDAIGVEKFVEGVTIGVSTSREEWQRLIDSGEIKLTQQVVDSGLASETQVDFFNKVKPDAMSILLFSPSEALNFVPPALLVGLGLLLLGAFLAATDFFAMGYGAIFLGCFFLIAPFIWTF